jgi:hypothetical protein
MKAEDILCLFRPEQLFTNSDAAEIKKRYYALSKEWHPDLNSDSCAKLVFARINELHDEAVKKSLSGAWGYKGLVTLKTVGNDTYRIRYHSVHDFELGRFYVGDEHVTYVMAKEHEGMWNNAVAMTRKFKFESERMGREMSPSLPDPPEQFVTDAGEFVLVFSKPKKWVLLRDVLNYYNGRMDPRHVAWILSRLNNITCYLHYAKITHNEISPDTVFIDPADHKAALLGGWWYAVPSGRALKKVSKRTHGLLPWKVRIDKRASRKTDLELLRATGLDLLGKARAAAPKDMRVYLESVATKNAFNEYKDWTEVLVKSFGARRFTVMDLTPEQLYPKG